MMLRHMILFGCLACQALFASSPITWVSDYQEALEQAHRDEKPLLLFFTGSDWSGWGMKMKKEILDSPQFAEKVGNHFVFVEIDFPKHKNLSLDESEQNVQLKEKMDISEYPRLVVMDSAEREIARLGYTSEEGEVLGQDLLQIVERDQSLSNVMRELEFHSDSSSQLEGYYALAQELQRLDDCDRILEKGLRSSSPHFFQLEKYRLLVEEGKREKAETVVLRHRLLESDPNNEKGAHFTLALIDFQHLSCQEPLSREVIQPLEEYLAKFGAQDSDNLWRIEMMIAQFYLDFDESMTALKHAETAFRSAPDEMKEEIGHSLDYIREQAGCIVSNSS